jgi:hypothetical protein
MIVVQTNSALFLVFLVIFLVSDQLDAPLFSIYLFHVSTLYMFRALCAHPQERQNCINTASGIVNPYLCPCRVMVGSRR